MSYSTLCLDPRLDLPLPGQWAENAACTRAPELFTNNTKNCRHDEFAEAKRVCASCPVIGACRQYVDETEKGLSARNWQVGVYAGESPLDRFLRRRDDIKRCASCGVVGVVGGVRPKDVPQWVKLLETDTLCHKCAKREASPSYSTDLGPCRGGCGHKLRGLKVSAKDAPGTRKCVNAKRRLCKQCAIKCSDSTRPCVGCGRLLRHPRLTVKDLPETLYPASWSKGLCSRCNRRIKEGKPTALGGQLLANPDHKARVNKK